mgnify:CR=1 FL=1
MKKVIKNTLTRNQKSLEKKQQIKHNTLDFYKNRQTKIITYKRLGELMYKWTMWLTLKILGVEKDGNGKYSAFNINYTIITLSQFQSIFKNKIMYNSYNKYKKFYVLSN